MNKKVFYAYVILGLAFCAITGMLQAQQETPASPSVAKSTLPTLAQQMPPQATQSVPSAGLAPAPFAQGTQPAQTLPPIGESAPQPQPSEETSIIRVPLMGNIPTAEIIQKISRLFPSLKVIFDAKSSSLFIRGEEKEVQKACDLIYMQWNVSPEKNDAIPTNVALRVYAVEVLVRETTPMFPFCMSLNIMNAQFAPLETIVKLGDGVQITNIQIQNGKSPEWIAINLEGKVTGYAILNKIADSFREASGAKTEMSNVMISGNAKDSPINNPLYNQLNQLFSGQEPPADTPSALKEVKKTLNDLLGNELSVRGYWFGNSSLPGDCSVPIGPWNLEIVTTTHLSGDGNPDSPSESVVRLTVNENDVNILTNTINVRMGRPVIVGYTRHEEGTDIPGALVVIPEAEFGSQTNPDLKADPFRR